MVRARRRRACSASASHRRPIAGKAALDAARAAFHTGQASGYPIARKAIIAGLSQGAFSTMAAATMLPTYANQLEIRGFVAAEPPSNMRHTTNTELTSTAVFVGYDAMRLYSWEGLYGLDGGQLFQPPYDTKAPAWFASACLYNGSDGTAGTLYTDFVEPLADGGPGTTPVPASAIFSSTFLGYAQTDSWPESWLAAFAASNTVPSNLALPVLIFEGTADETVLPATVRHHDPRDPT